MKRMFKWRTMKSKNLRRCLFWIDKEISEKLLEKTNFSDSKIVLAISAGLKQLYALTTFETDRVMYSRDNQWVMTNVIIEYQKRIFDYHFGYSCSDGALNEHQSSEFRFDLKKKIDFFMSQIQHAM